jgi:ubiquinone/menaquinone biosynthesis C-methylase UbiE
MKSPVRLSNGDYYDRFAETYEERRHHGYHAFIDALETELILPHVTGRDVLEVGCGTGLILRTVAPVARRAVGIDLSLGMLNVAKERGLEVEQASVTSLPFPDASFDVTYSFKVLAHVEDIQRALSEVSRVTRPGGRLFLEFYNRHSLRYLVRRLRGRQTVGQEIYDDQVYIRYDRPSDILRRLEPDLLHVNIHGIRIFTPFPGLVEWPVFGRGLKALERKARDSRLARLGGFFVVECIRR